MAWIRYESGTLAHPKWQEVPASVRPDAIALHIAFSGHSADYLTDGFVPSDMHPVLAKKAGVRRRKVALEVLLKTGLFEHRENGVQIHDYLDYNPSREDVKEQRRIDAEKKKRAREAKKQQMSLGDNPGESPEDKNGDVPSGQAGGPSRDRAGARSHPTPKKEPTTEPLGVVGGSTVSSKASSADSDLTSTPPTLSPSGVPFDPTELIEAGESESYIDMRRRMWVREGP